MTATTPARSPKPRSVITAATPPTSTAPQRHRTAIHEAGHAVVARLLSDHLGVTSIRASVLFPDGSGNTRLDTARDNFAGVAAIGWAGCVAEARSAYGAGYTTADVRALLNTTGRADRTALMAGGDPYLDGLGLDDARAAVEALWPAIGKLATTLETRGIARDRDVLTAMGVDPDGSAEQVAAAISLRRSAILRR